MLKDWKKFCNNHKQKRLWWHLYIILLKSFIGLYSGRTEHFWPMGVPIFTKLFEMVLYMKKLRSRTSENIVSLGCVKNGKNAKREKPGFEGILAISQNSKVNFYDFFAKNTLKRLAKNFFQKFFPFLRKNQLCKNWNFSKTCSFIYLKFKT